MSDHIVHVQRAADPDPMPINIQGLPDQGLHEQLSQADSDAVSQLINDPDFQRAVQEQVAASSSGETVYLQVTTGTGEHASIPTSIVLNNKPPAAAPQPDKLITCLPRKLVSSGGSGAPRLVRPASSLPAVDPAVPMSSKCLCCNTTNTMTLRTIKGNAALLSLFSEMMTSAFPASDEKFRVCDACIAAMDKMKEMRDNMRANFLAVDGNFQLQTLPATKPRFREDGPVNKRLRADDDDDRGHERDLHRSEASYNRSKKAIEISGLLTKQYLNIAPFTDEERLSIAGVINVASPVELAAKIMKVPALLNAIKKLLLLEINHTCEKLCSSVQAPGPSVLRLKGVNTISEDDLISEIVVELRRCLPFVMDIFYCLCRPLHAPRVECREILAVMYAMGLYCRSPSLTAVRRINVQRILTNRTLRPRLLPRDSGK